MSLLRTSLLHFPDLAQKISNAGPDVHSGIEGGAIAEPMIDMYAYPVQSTSIKTHVLLGSGCWRLWLITIVLFKFQISVSLGPKVDRINF